MIGHKFIPSRDGGVEVVVSNLAPHLAKAGYDVTCYNRTNKQFKALRKSGPLPREYEGVRLIWTPTVDRRGLAAVTSSVIATVMASFRRYDLIHFHTEGPCVLCGLPKLMGKKVVVTIHGLDHMPRPCLPMRSQSSSASPPGNTSCSWAASCRKRASITSSRRIRNFTRTKNW